MRQGRRPVRPGGSEELRRARLPESLAVSRVVRHSPTHVVAAALTLLGFIAVSLALGGCGGGAVVDPSLAAVASPAGFTVVSYPAAGVKLSVPRNWTTTPEPAPMLAVFSSGPAVMSLWRYPSTHPALTEPSQLQTALGRLTAAIRAREPSVRVQATGISRVDGDGAVIIDATERVNGRLRRVRTEHVYVDGAELVLDAYAPVSQFPTVDHAVFSPTRKSLALIHGSSARPAMTASTTTATATASPALTASTTTATASPGAAG
jgi:hypothetical protein